MSPIRPMGARIRRVVAAVVVLFIALIGNATYIQFVKADDYANNPANPRVLLTRYDHPRGQILAGSLAVATSKKTTDRLKFLRSYPNPLVYAPVTGYYGVNNSYGIEHLENKVLSGTDDRLAINRFTDEVTGHNPKPGNLVLTVNPKAQQAAWDSMKKQTGAVVALDPRTGAVLAMVSTPSYDPNALSSHDPTASLATYNKLAAEPTNPLLDRAISQTYPPGSTFKTVISAAALASGKYQPDTRVPSPDALTLPGTTHQLHNFDGETCGNGQTDTLIDAFAISCNTAYGDLGMTLGSGAVQSQAEKFGITGNGMSIPLTVAGSCLGAPKKDGSCDNTIPEGAPLAESSIGQQNVRITPLQAAMIASAVADGGTLMQPYLVKAVQAGDGSVVDTTNPKVFSKPMTADVAAKLNTMMQAVVNAPNGTGRPAQIPGVTVAGKTGTADNAPGKAPHAWFVGFAPAKNPTVAVAVLIEHGGVQGNETTGGKASAPIAKAVMQAVLAGGH